MSMNTTVNIGEDEKRWINEQRIKALQEGRVFNFSDWVRERIAEAQR